MNDNIRMSGSDKFGGLRKGTVSFFNEYVDKELIAKEWLRDMVSSRAYYAQQEGKRKKKTVFGYVMSSEMRQVGALSLGPALATLFNELAQIKDEDLNDIVFKKFEDREYTVMDTIASSITQLIDECFGKTQYDEDRILFPATPYADESMDDEWPLSSETFAVGDEIATYMVGGYLDTASWVLVVAQLASGFLDRMDKLGIGKDAGWRLKIVDAEGRPGYVACSVAQIKDKLSALYMASLRLACRCIVYDDKGNYLGWKFTISPTENDKKPCYAPDLYFSYAASTMYLGIYKEYEAYGIITHIRLLEKYLMRYLAKTQIVSQQLWIKKYFECFTGELAAYNGTSGPTKRIAELGKILDSIKENDMVEPEDSQQFVALEDFLFDIQEDKIRRDESASKAEGLACLKKLCYFFNVLNDGKTLTDFDGDAKLGVPIFTIMKAASVSSAKYFWDKFKCNIAKGACFPDGELASEEVITRSGHSNVLFNNLFLIGLVINSAYDAELYKQDEGLYNEMLKSFQIAVQNTQRYYDVFEKEGTTYKINSFILQFDQKINDVAAYSNDDAILAIQMRKLNMPACYLLPLLLKTNTVIGDYLVKYPQRQMTESLISIIEDRLREEGEIYWLWDKDGYNAISNYYYMDSLISFYRYYDTYEAPFVKKSSEIQKDYDEKCARLKEEFEDEKRALEGKLKSEYGIQLEQRQKKIEEYEGYRDSIIKFILTGIAEALNSQLSMSLLSVLKFRETHADSTTDEVREALRNIIGGEGRDGKQTTGDIPAQWLNWFAKMQLLSLLRSGSFNNATETKPLLALKKFIPTGYNVISDDDILEKILNEGNGMFEMMYDFIFDTIANDKK